jgi:4-hydroxybenzoyl-CoA thioesterase
MRSRCFRALSESDTLPYFIHRRPLTIEWGHCDPAGIVFNARFFEYFDWGTWTLFGAALGMPNGEWPKHYGIIGIPLVESGADFKAPLAFGDVAELASTVSAFRRSSFDVEHRITIDGRLAVEGRETRVWSGRDPADPSRIRSVPIPAEVIGRFTLR